MSGEVFDQKRFNDSQNTQKSNNSKGGKIFLTCFWVIIIGYYVLNLNFYQTVDCTVVSARATSGGGGLRAASSSQGVDVETEECGLIVFTRMQNEGFDSARDLADELNRHLGETLTFRVSYLHWGPYTARAVELEGFPIRD